MLTCLFQINFQQNLYWKYKISRLSHSYGFLYFTALSSSACVSDILFFRRNGGVIFFSYIVFIVLCWLPAVAQSVFQAWNLDHSWDHLGSIWILSVKYLLNLIIKQPCCRLMLCSFIADILQNSSLNLFRTSNVRNTLRDLGRNTVLRLLEIKSQLLFRLLLLLLVKGRLRLELCRSYSITTTEN